MNDQGRNTQQAGHGNQAAPAIHQDTRPYTRPAWKTGLAVACLAVAALAVVALIVGLTSSAGNTRPGVVIGQWGIIALIAAVVGVLLLRKPKEYR